MTPANPSSPKTHPLHPPFPPHLTNHLPLISCPFDSSGLSGAFLKEPPGPKFCNWYNGPCLLEYLDNLPTVERMGADKPLRLPIIDRCG